MDEATSIAEILERNTAVLAGLDEADVRDELMQATGGDAAFRLVRSAVSRHMATVASAEAPFSIEADQWPSVVTSTGALLDEARHLPDEVMALAAADFWSEEDVACRQAWAESPDDVDLDDPDPDEREAGRGPVWEGVWAAQGRRQAINRALVDAVLAWTGAQADGTWPDDARRALVSEARSVVESSAARSPRFDIAYRAQDAVGRLRALSEAA